MNRGSLILFTMIALLGVALLVSVRRSEQEGAPARAAVPVASDLEAQLAALETRIGQLEDRFDGLIDIATEAFQKDGSKAGKPKPKAEPTSLPNAAREEIKDIVREQQAQAARDRGARRSSARHDRQRARFEAFAAEQSLTAEQMQAITTAFDEEQSVMQDANQRMIDGTISRRDARRESRQARQRTMKTIQETLTPEQFHAYRELDRRPRREGRMLRQ